MQRTSYDDCKEAFLAARATGNWNDVVLWATELLGYDEKVAWVWAQRGIGLGKLGHPIDAILNYDKALELESSLLERATLLNNKGSAYWDIFNSAKALYFIQQAIETHPFPESYMTLGHIHKYNGDLKRAVHFYREAIELAPDYADGHMALGMALLKDGLLAEGWKEYEWRWKTDQLPERKLKIPRWWGENLNGKSILVYAEQGLGDIIQFSRYAVELSKRYPKGRVIVEGRPVLHRLLSTMSAPYAVMNVGERLPEVDYAIPMISLAGMLTPTFASIQPVDNLFEINHVDIARWKQKFDEANIPGKRIGICWAGMSRTNQPVAAAVDSIRSLELRSFAPLAKIPGIFWISLQKGPPATQIKTPPSGMTIGDFSEDMHDFYETCAAMAACDLVITVDTAVVHAAASIGRPTWMLSRWDGCWRWFGDRLKSPWYPTLLQFVQKKPHDWTGVMQDVAEELARFVKK